MIDPTLILIALSSGSLLASSDPSSPPSSPPPTDQDPLTGDTFANFPKRGLPQLGRWCSSLWHSQTEAVALVVRYNSQWAGTGSDGTLVPKRQPSGEIYYCRHASQDMVNRYLKSVGDPARVVLVGNETIRKETAVVPEGVHYAKTGRGKLLVDPERAQRVVGEIQAELDQGRPVAVLVSRQVKPKGLKERQGTDHVITITGYEYDENGEKVFTFLDPGTTSRDRARGTLTVNEEGNLSGPIPYRPKKQYELFGYYPFKT